MLTRQEIIDMPPQTIFAEGTAIDNDKGINFDRTNKMLRWVAVRGYGHDWAVYVAPEEWNKRTVADHGHKLQNIDTIRRLVECDDEAISMYRK